MVVLACVRFTDWDRATEEKPFESRFSAFFDGMRPKKDQRFSILLYQTAYFLRRAALSATLVFWNDFVWG